MSKMPVQERIAIMRNAYRNIHKPVRFTMDVVYFDEIDPAVILLRFYHAEWVNLTEDEKIEAALYMGRVKDVVEQHGFPCSLDPVIDDMSSQIV